MHRDISVVAALTAIGLGMPLLDAAQTKHLPSTIRLIGRLMFVRCRRATATA